MRNQVRVNAERGGVTMRCPACVTLARCWKRDGRATVRGAVANVRTGLARLNLRRVKARAW
jgi:hypothetical protein